MISGALRRSVTSRGFSTQKRYSAYSARRSPPESRWRTSGPPLKGVGGRYAIFQMAEVAVPRQVFASILALINGLRGPPSTAVSA